MRGKSNIATHVATYVAIYITAGSNIATHIAVGSNVAIYIALSLCTARTIVFYLDFQHYCNVLLPSEGDFPV